MKVSGYVKKVPYFVKGWEDFYDGTWEIEANKRTRCFFPPPPPLDKQATRCPVKVSIRYMIKYMNHSLHPCDPKPINSLHSLEQRKISAPLFLVALVSICLCLPLGQASAAVVVNIDVNGQSTDTFSGQGAYTTADAHEWNGYDLSGTVYVGSGGTTGLSGPLVDSAGNPTTVQIDLFNFIRTLNLVTGAPSNATGNSLIDDFAYASPGDYGNDGLFHSSFVLSGLTPGAAYDLYVYGAVGKVPFSTDYSVNGVVQSVTGRSSASTPALFTQGVDYTIYSAVAADGSGDITGFFKGASLGALDGVQIVAVPEPQTWALSALGLSAVFFRLRRHRRE
jgi:hypothetical protein